jgi:hypothetical protein
MEVPVAFDDSLTKWVESSDAGTCSGMGTTPGFGTFNFGSDPSQIFYIYAEDDDGTPFSCTVDERPDAVPLRGVVAEFSLAADGQLASGTLTGCLSEADADSLCSCIGACDPSLPVPPSCEGCMPGGLPLGSLLSGINTSENCTTLLGEPAFDMVVGFTATRIPSIPETCM